MWAMRLLLNAGFGDPLGVDVLRDIHGQGFAGIRQEVKRTDTVRPLCGEIAEAGAQAILLVCGGQMGPEGSGRATPPAEIAALAREVATVGVELDLFNGRYPCAIEVGNEPDNAYEYESRPELFAEAVRLSRDAIRDLHPYVTIITGGVMSTGSDALEYLARASAAGLPDDCAIGYHTYRTTSEPEKPAKGFRSRGAEFKRLKEIAAGRPIWCTEAGWHTAPSYVRSGFFGKRKVQFTDEQVAEFAEREIRINAQQGAVALAWFQLNDGRDPAVYEHCFGVRRRDGTWKPVANRIGILGPDFA